MWQETYILYNNNNNKQLVRNISTLSTFGAGIIFLILAHPVYKMWIIQEPNMLELWNIAFWREKDGEYRPC